MVIMSKEKSFKKRDKQFVHSSKTTSVQPKSGKIKRKLSCTSIEECETHSARKRQQRDSINNNYFYKSLRYVSDEHNQTLQQNDRFLIEDKLILNRVGSSELGLWKNPEKLNRNLPKCWINDLPDEILLKILGYLPLGMLINTTPHICKKWRILSLDWTLWKAVENLTIKNMVISTAKLKTLLRIIPKLKKLELILRDDTEELLHVVFENHKNLEALKLDRCYRSTLHMNVRSQTVNSILECCPELKTIIINDTYFQSLNFYRNLARKFKSIERINITCTSENEMNVFVETLKENISDVEFQKVPMMGKAAGKQIYWGPILGLVVRPIPTSPFHQQYNNNNYPNYAF